MMLKTKTLVAGAALVALAACGSSKSWNQEAGALIDEGGFGNPTMQNMLAQMCSGKAKGHIIADPIVVADPNSSASKPVYRQGRVLCSGHLNGKYAQVIFNGYRASARPGSDLDGGLQAIEAAAGGN